jgi:hypothetical protein
VSQGVELRRQYSFSDRLRQCNRAEECFRIKVILAGFIDDPQHVVLLCGGIAQRYVDFALLERDRITFVSTQTTSCFACDFVMISKQLLDLQFLAPDPGSLIPTASGPVLREAPIRNSARLYRRSASAA